MEFSGIYIIILEWLYWYYIWFYDKKKLLLLIEGVFRDNLG